MKKTIIILFISLIAFKSEAQLLKKLKDKAQQSIENAVIDETSKSEKTENNNDTDERENARENDNSSSEKRGVAQPQKTKSVWVPDSFCSKIFTLKAGEKLLYDETKVFEKQGDAGHTFIIVDNNYKYYLINNGLRTGPYNSPPVKENDIQVEDEDNDNETDNNESTYSGRIIIGEERDPIAQKYCKTISNKLFIVFNGKNFGPYDFVGKMMVSPDKSKFFAAVIIGGEMEMMSKMGMGNSFIVNESGMKQKIGDSKQIMYNMNISQGFKAASITTFNSDNQKVLIVSSSGKKQEGSMTDLSSSSSILKIADNGDIIYVPAQSPTQLLVNGTEAATFSIPIKNSNLLYLAPNYKNSVYYQKGKLYKGDGSEEKLSGILYPKFLFVNGKLKVCYFKTLKQDNGETDVWLCKRVLQ